MAARKVTLLLTQEQEETIKALFNHSDWEYIEIKSTKVCRKRKALHESESACSSPQLIDSTGNSGPGGDGDNVGNDRCGDGDGGGGGQNAAQAEGRCRHCFMDPCVVTVNHQLCGQGQGPSENNPPIRKDIYKKFWRVIDNLGGWLIEAYRIKKSSSANLQNIVYLKRDIMPECVLDFVRGRYSNPYGQRYMGHKWE